MSLELEVLARPDCMVLAAGQGEDEVDRAQERSSLAGRPGAGAALLVNGGSFIHVAPLDFAAWLPLTDTNKKVRAATAGGKPLRYEGMRRVTMETRGGPLTLDFHIMDVTRPILSAGELLNEGHALVMSGSGNAIYTKAKQRIPLARNGNLSYLSVVTPELKERPSKVWTVRPPPKPIQASRRAARRQRDKLSEDQEPAERPWVLLEWACEKDSRLSAWFLKHGQQAVRLTEDNVDLARPGAVARVLRIARMWTQRGYRVLTWAALPCTAWCPWQRLNVAHQAPATHDLTERRARSVQMVETRPGHVPHAPQARAPGGGVRVRVASSKPRVATAEGDRAVRAPLALRRGAGRLHVQPHGQC